MRLRIDLAYDGSGFSGFARQADRRTVQGVLEAALSRLCGQPVVTTGAGRTDAGVHALGQVVTFDVPAGGRPVDDPDGVRRALARMVRPELTIWSVAAVGDDFDARFSALARRYRYKLADGESLAPLRRHDIWHVGPPRLDVAAMAAGGAHLVGEHDFSSFCRRVEGRHLVRRVHLVDVAREDEGSVVVDVDGAAFCHQQVRSIVGALVRVGRGLRPPDWVAETVAARDRAVVGAIAPPHGLTLVGVDYS